MTYSSELQAIFRTGYDGAPAVINPFLRSSRSWEALELGRWMHQTGRMVDAVRPSRGDTWKTKRGLLLRFHYLPHGQFQITREQ